MSCIFTRPQTEAVVVFAGEDGPLHTRRGNSAHPLFRIHFRGIEYGRILCSVSPLLTCKGIYGKVKKGIKSQILYLDLPCMRSYFYESFIKRSFIFHLSLLPVCFPVRQKPYQCFHIKIVSPQTAFIHTAVRHGVAGGRFGIGGM